MKKLVLPLVAALWATVFALYACSPAPVVVQLEGGLVDASLVPAAPSSTDQKRSAAPYPFPPPGDAGTVLTSTSQVTMPAWQPLPNAVLPDGGAGAIWYESDSGAIAALPACANGFTIEWSNGFPTCVPLPGDAGASVVLPDAGAGGLWYQGDAGPNPPLGFPECTSSQVLGWSGSANTPACITPAGDVTGSLAANTVGKMQGNTVTAGALTKGSFLVASTTSNWADTALSGDATESAVTPGSIEVTGLLNNALPSLATGYLNWNGSAWALSAVSGGFTAGSDLSGTSTSQYVVNISGGSTPGTVTITSPTLSASQATTLKTTAGAMSVDSFTALNLGTSTATSIAMGKSGITTTITGGLTQLTGAVSLTGNGASSFTTSSSTLTLDANTALNLGNTNATSIVIGNSSNTTAITLGVKTGDTVNVAVNATTVDQFGGATAVFGASSTYALDFNSTVTGATIGFSGANAAAGVGLSINGQGAGGTGNSGGSVTINGGGSTTTGTPGNVNINVTGPSGTPHGFISLQENQVGYLNAAPAYSASYAPAPAATVTPQTAYLYGTSPNGACSSSAACSPGSVIVDISAVGATGSPTEAGLAFYRGGIFYGSLQAWTGGATTDAAMYLGRSVTPGNLNYALRSNGTDLHVNNPGAGSVLIEGNGTANLIVGSTITYPPSDFYTALGNQAHRFSNLFASNYNWTPLSGSTNTQANVVSENLYNLNTTATATATVALVPIPASHAITVRSYIVGRLAAAAFTPLACETIGTFANNGGAISQAGTTTAVSAQGLTCAQSISSTNVAVTVFGQVSTSTDFVADIKVIEN